MDILVQFILVMETFNIRTDERDEVIEVYEDIERVNDENEDYIRIFAFISSLFIFIFPIIILG